MWQGSSFMMGKLLVLGTTVLLARLLTPDDFGVVGLALVFIVYAESITDLGVAQALVYLAPNSRMKDAGLLVSLVMSGTLATLAFFAAPMIADFFGRHETAAMFRVLSIALLLRGFGQVPDGLLRRDLLFRRRMIATSARALAQGAVSIALAFAGLGPWSIVWGYVVGETVQTTVIWALVDFRPTLRFWHVELSAIRLLMAYGGPATANALLYTLLMDVDYLIVGRQLGSEALGYYTLAFRIPQLAIINVFYVISTVAFPLFSRAREDPARLERGYFTSLRLQAVYGIAVGVGLATTAPMVIQVLFGAKWSPSVVPLQALALYAAFRSLAGGSVDVWRGIGRPALAMWIALIRLTLLVPLLLYAARYGIEAVAWVQAIVAGGAALLMQSQTARLLRLTAKEIAMALVPAGAVGVGVGVGTGAVSVWLNGPEAVRLVLALGAGAVLGLGAIYVAAPTFFSEIRGLLVRRPRRDQPKRR